MEALLKDLKRKYETIYIVTIKDVQFIFRPLTRLEYKELQMFHTNNNYEMEEKICETAVVYPEYDFSESGLAGIAHHLSQQIIFHSGLANINQLDIALEYYRNDMTRFESQAEVYINQAFPNISFDEMKSWTIDKFMMMLARAEWALQHIHNLPISFKKPEEEEDFEDDPYEPTMQEIADNIRAQGGDPMFELAHIIRRKPPFADFPLIGGTKLLENEGVLENVREQIQRVSK